MLLNKVGPEQADWYLIAKDGNLTAKVTPGLCIGEDPSGLLLLSPKSGESLLRFNVDAWGRLELQPANDAVELLSPQRRHCRVYSVEPLAGVSVWLPNNELYLANDLEGNTLRYDDLPVTVVPRTPGRTTTQPPRAVPSHAQQPLPDTASGQSVTQVSPQSPPEASEPTNLEATIEIEVESVDTVFDAELEREAERELAALQIPLLDSPVERLREPNSSETLITELPYGFEPRGFTTTEQVTVLDERFARSHVLRRSSRIMLVLLVVLVGIAAGLLAARFNLIDYPLRAAEPRTAFNPATPKLVLLSEREVEASVQQPAAEKLIPVAPPEPPETTPSTPSLTEAVVTPADPPTNTVYRTDLADAMRLFDQGYITGPAERNSVSILNRILRDEPDHQEAVVLLKRCADRMLEAAVTAQEHGLDFEARNLVEEVMAFYPDHQRALALWARWAGPTTGA